MSTTQELIEALNERSRLLGKSYGPFDVIDTVSSFLLASAADRLASLSAENDALRGKLAWVDEKALEAGSQAGLAAYEAERDLHDVFRAAIAAYLAAVRDTG